jgi:hypothetical protein
MTLLNRKIKRKKVIMKKTLIFALICFLLFVVSACNSNENQAEDKYVMNASYSYGGDLEKTEISYVITISGTKEVIENIDVYEVLINEEYSELMLENAPHTPYSDLGEESYFKVEGSFVFDTNGKTKEEIDEMDLLQGIRIIDKDENEDILKFHRN